MSKYAIAPWIPGGADELVPAGVWRGLSMPMGSSFVIANFFHMYHSR
jgi:hypothetical protein